MPAGLKDEGRLLALLAGQYVEMAPYARLQPHIRCAWIHQLPDEIEGGITVVPDCCSDLIWTGRELCIVGPDRTAAFPDIPAGSRLLGVRFAPGRAGQWLRLPLSDIVGRTVALGDIAPGLAAEFEDRIAEVGSDNERIDLMLRAVDRAGRETPASAAMQFVLRRLDNASGRRNSIVDDLTAELGISERSLRRRCHEVFGYGARTLDRILRFQRFLQQVSVTRPRSLAWLAAEAGYADQAHMTREVRDMSGLTPAAVMRQFKGSLAVSFNTGAVRTPYPPRMEVEHVHDDGKDRSSIC